MDHQDLNFLCVFRFCVSSSAPGGSPSSVSALLYDSQSGSSLPPGSEQLPATWSRSKLWIQLSRRLRRPSTSSASAVLSSVLSHPGQFLSESAGSQHSAPDSIYCACAKQSWSWSDKLHPELLGGSGSGAGDQEHLLRQGLASQD